VPPKIARKFKKASPTKKDNDLVPVDEELVTKGKRVKRSIKKSSTKPAIGIVIREPPVEAKYKGNEKEKVDVAHGKGIELLSKVALTKKAQLKEVRKKSLREFHMTHPSGSGTGTEKPLSVEKITPTVISKGTCNKLGVPDVTEDDSTESESDSWEQDKESDDDNQEEEEVDQENVSEDDEIESDEDKGIDDTTDQFDDDVDARLEEPTQTGKEFKKNEVHVTSSSRSSDLASKFLNFLDIPQTDAEIVSPLDFHVHHEVPRTHAPTLLTIPVSVITESSPVFTNIPQSSQTFTPPPILTTPTPSPIIKTTNPLSTLPDFASVFRFNDRIRKSLTARIKEQVKDQLPQILPKEVSNFTPLVIEKLIKESHDEVTLEKPKKKDSTSGSSKGTKSQPKSSGKSVQSKEPVFEVADSDMPHDQEGNMGDNEDEPWKETASRRDWFKKPTPPQEPTDPDWNIGKTTQEGPTQNWLMTLAASTSTDKSLKDFDELIITPIDISGYILNGLKIENLTQEILLGPVFRLLKGTRSNYAKLEYDFEECYKASEKLD
ncbi:hypothetical protein Tco_1050518, partial [Tanacetum coccineum]